MASKIVKNTGRPKRPKRPAWERDDPDGFGKAYARAREVPWRFGSHQGRQNAPQALGNTEGP